MVPGQVVRFENGSQIASFKFQTAQVSALANDTVFIP